MHRLSERTFFSFVTQIPILCQREMKIDFKNALTSRMKIQSLNLFQLFESKIFRWNKRRLFFIKSLEINFKSDCIKERTTSSTTSEFFGAGGGGELLKWISTARTHKLLEYR